MTTLDQSARALFLKDMIGAFFLSMRYFFAPKKTQCSCAFLERCANHERRA